MSVRVNDSSTSGAIVVGTPATRTVINKKPACVKGASLSDGSVVVSGSSRVLIEKRPATRLGDLTTKGVVSSTSTNTLTEGG